MKLRKYTPKQLKEAVASSFSYRQTLQKLAVAPAGGNYAVLKKAIKYFKLDTTHFKGQGWNRGLTGYVPPRPIEDYLTNKFPIQSYKLKKRILKDGLLAPICMNCGNTEWQGQPIPLELHHKDGVSKNNELSNLQLLCPNCHALTDNYRGKNKLKH